MEARSNRTRERLELVARIGEGGMAEIYLATLYGIEGFARLVAVKRLRAEVAVDPRHGERFVHEARLGAALDHPNIVQTIDFVNLDGRAVLVLELVRGADLLRLLEAATRAQRRVSTEVAVAVAIDLLSGLSHAHERVPAVVHGDVSPANVMISVHGQVKLLDFGVATTDGTSGTLRGKPGYMAPEMVRGEPVGPRADLFAVGTLLWEMLTLRRLFKSEDDTQTLRNIAEARIGERFARHGYVPETLRSILAKALARDPDERWSSARDMARALCDWLAEASLVAPDRDRGSLLSSWLRELVPDVDHDYVRTEPPPLPTAALDLSHLEAVLDELERAPELAGFEKLVAGTWVDPLSLAAVPDREAELDFAAPEARAVSLGALDPWTMPAILLSLAAHRFTGGLTIVDGWRRKTCTFGNGHVVRITANEPAEPQLELGAAADSALVERFIASTEQHFIDLFRWTKGHLLLEPSIATVPPGLVQNDVPQLVMRALRASWSDAKVVGALERYAARVVRWRDAQTFGPEELGLLQPERDALVMLARGPHVHEVLTQPSAAQRMVLLALVQATQVRLAEVSNDT